MLYSRLVGADEPCARAKCAGEPFVSLSRRLPADAPTAAWHKTVCVLCSANCGVEVRLEVPAQPAPHEAARALEASGDPAPLVAELSAIHDAIERTKRIFDVTLVEGGRRFHGEGALSYRARPLAARGDVFGPQSTPVLRFSLIEDSLTVVLPREGEILRGRLGDPRFADVPTAMLLSKERAALGARFTRGPGRAPRRLRRPQPGGAGRPDGLRNPR